MYQLPVAGTEEIRGDTRIYTIDFAQTMSMYNNGGNSSFNFSALYKRIYTLKGYSQNMYENTRAGWSLDLDTHAETHDTTRVAYGVQVYETNKLAAPECTLYFNYIWDDGTFEGHSTTFILDYSAETMAKAEVG
ncbi:hypothetical protein APHAL10511_005296 [Amanita phalloides]|nr:hypothetical protein APHAL10511_005296 [Amanita phalloides]